MNKKFLLFLLAACLAVSQAAISGEIDNLVDKLVDKGILTQAEAYKLVTEAKEEGRKKEALLPKWIKNTSFKGDVRIRYENQDVKRTDYGKTDKTKSRGRVRFRWGFKTQVNL